MNKAQGTVSCCSACEIYLYIYIYMYLNLHAGCSPRALPAVSISSQEDEDCMQLCHIWIHRPGWWQASAQGLEVCALFGGRISVIPCPPHRHRGAGHGFLTAFQQQLARQ